MDRGCDAWGRVGGRARSLYSENGAPWTIIQSRAFALGPEFPIPFPQRLVVCHYPQVSPLGLDLVSPYPGPLDGTLHLYCLLPLGTEP